MMSNLIWSTFCTKSGRVCKFRCF